MEGINYFFKGEKMVVTASVNLFEDNICKPIGNIKVYLNVFSSNNKISDSLELTKRCIVTHKMGLYKRKRQTLKVDSLWVMDLTLPSLKQ